MQLIPHPDHGSRAVSGVSAIATRTGQILQLRFELSGDTAGLRVAAGRGRTDGLWRSTCFEVFVGRTGDGYLEYNFAPSGAWAAYGFECYREGMGPIAVAPITSWDGAALDAEVSVPTSGDWRINLTAVIEERDGTKSYWALAHPEGPPDFHDPACFVLEVPAPV